MFRWGPSYVWILLGCVLFLMSINELRKNKVWWFSIAYISFMIVGVIIVLLEGGFIFTAKFINVIKVTGLTLAFIGFMCLTVGSYIMESRKGNIKKAKEIKQEALKILLMFLVLLLLYVIVMFIL